MWSELKYNLLEALHKGIDLAKITLLILVALYVVLALGQMFFWDCFMPSCHATADITQGKFFGFVAVVLIELVFLLIISILLPIAIGIVKALFYGAVFALAIVMAIVGVGLVIGAVALVYTSFRDFGFWGGLAAIVGVGVVIGMFGGRAKGYATSQWDNYSDRRREDALAQEIDDRNRQQAYAEQRKAEEMANRLDSPYQDNPNLYGENPYANKD